MYQSNGTTRTGFLGFSSTSNSNFLIYNDTATGSIGLYTNAGAGLVVNSDQSLNVIGALSSSAEHGLIGTNSGRTIIQNTGGGYIEVKSGNATYGLIIRDYNSYLELGYRTATGPLYIADNDMVGIGDSTPSYKLDVNGTLRATGDTEVGGNFTTVGNSFLMDLAVVGSNLSLYTGQRVEFRNGGGQTYSSYNGCYYEYSQANNSYARSVLTTEAGEDYDILGPGVYSSNIYWFWKWTSSTTTYRVITAGSSFTFTGQHLTVPMDSDISSSLSDYVGLIAVSSGNQMRWDEIKEEWVTGSEAVTINETLPRIELATSRADKRVFGVISNRPDNYVVNSETNEIEEDQDGTAYLWNDLKQTQIRVNSLGEGALWVCNINSNLENGDYVTSCEIPGLGMKQDDDQLHNYTVAKITQDCDFNLSSSAYNCQELEFSGSTYRKAFVGCTYHCG
jgi:hypothetical protein